MRSNRRSNPMVDRHMAVRSKSLITTSSFEQHGNKGAPKERPPRWTVPIPGWAISELDLGDLLLPSRGRKTMIAAGERSVPKTGSARALLGIAAAIRATVPAPRFLHADVVGLAVKFLQGVDHFIKLDDVPGTTLPGSHFCNQCPSGSETDLVGTSGCRPRKAAVHTQTASRD